MFRCVRMAFGLQLSHSIHDVNKSGNKSEHAGGDDDVEQGKKMELQHDPCNRRHLQNRGDFAGPTWLHMHFAVEQM